PAEVLATLEGMDEQLVQAIIEERENEPFGSRGDLLRLDDVSDQVFTQIVEDISARSSSLRITSVGSLEEGRIRVKLTVIVDLKSDEPQIVHIVEG
ncbi:MAG TPA: helix-hairpin-helix domain-containing protein, partial [Armatimonadota bacterium]|nr:helix-hairpin-helix domain-containing protein [Armatimonadota bacterium]